MKRILGFAFILLVCSCQNSETTQNHSNIPYNRLLAEQLKPEFYGESKDNNTKWFEDGSWWALSDYWVADSISLTKVKGEYNFSDRDLFVRFVDSSNWICRTNINWTCAVGMTIYDTIQVCPHGTFLDLYISGSHISVKDFEYNASYQIIESDSTLITLKSI